MDELLKILAENEGACLYWQLPDAERVLAYEYYNAPASPGTLHWDGDLVVHPDAIMVEPGTCYTMKWHGLKAPWREPQGSGTD